MARIGNGETPESMIRKYDESGPGVVGYYLDLKASMVAQLDYRIQKWNPATVAWEYSDNPTANTALHRHLIGHNDEDLNGIVFDIARELEAIGELAFAEIPPEPGQPESDRRYAVLPQDADSFLELVKHRPEIGQTGVYAFKLRGKATKPKNVAAARASDDWLVLEHGNAKRIYRPHPKYKRDSYSPMLRSLDEIRRLSNVSRAMHRSTASLLALSRVLFFKGDERDNVTIDPRTKQPVYGKVGRQIQELIEYSERNVTDVEETRTEGVMPYPVVMDEPPQLIDITKVVDPELTQLKEEALRDLARSWNSPQSIITEGPGSAQRMLNEWLQDKSFREGSIMPMARIISSALTVSFLQPHLRMLRQQSNNKLDLRPSDYRVWPDETPLLGEQELEPSDVARLAELGLLSRRGAAEIIGQETNLLELPDGVTDYDWWVQVRSSSRRRDGRTDPVPEPELPVEDPTVDEPVEDVTAGLNQWMTTPYRNGN